MPPSAWSAAPGSPPEDGSPPPQGSVTAFVLTLFVTDSTPGSVRARAQLEGWLRRAGWISVQLEVVDVLQRPDLAESEHILATPALVRHEPPPRRKIIGDLSGWDAVILALDLQDREAW
jgi:circadian clock protein KaiB